VPLHGDPLPKLITPVPPTPGVNAPVAKPPPGHQLPADIAKQREAAEKELAARFTIVDAKKKGPRAPNEITAAEFHKLAATYSDIQAGRGDLTIDPSKSKDPDQYRADMMNDIADIMQTKSGRELIEDLSNAQVKDEHGKLVHRHTTLQPGLDLAGNVDPTRAQENATDNKFGKGHRNLDGSAGVGIDTTIDINPNMDVVALDENNKVTSRMRSDVVLYHEMVHAYTDTHGITANGDVKANETKYSGLPFPLNMINDPNVEHDVNTAYGVRREEYQAAGLGEFSNDRMTENAYRRERNQLAGTGKGLPGDLLMEQRERYDSNDDYRTLGGL
jgi:hypothetical protein